MAELNNAAGNSGRKTGRKKMPVPRIDLTAMVDLAFLLITFFMFTTTFTKPKLMPVAMPDKNGPAVTKVPASRTLTVCLGKDSKVIWYLGLPNEPILAPQVAGYGKNGLRKAITDAKAYVHKTTGKTIMVLVKPANSSVYADLVNTLDELEITEVPTYAIADISATDINLLKQKGIY